MYEHWHPVASRMTALGRKQTFADGDAMIFAVAHCPTDHAFCEIYWTLVAIR